MLLSCGESTPYLSQLSVLLFVWCKNKLDLPLSLCESPPHLIFNPLWYHWPPFTLGIRSRRYSSFTYLLEFWPFSFFVVIYRLKSLYHNLWSSLSLYTYFSDRSTSLLVYFPINLCLWGRKDTSRNFAIDCKTCYMYIMTLFLTLIQFLKLFVFLFL